MDSQGENLLKLARLYGVELATESVCEGHTAPFEFLRSQIIDRHSIQLCCGPRGGGKSFISGFACWLDSILHDRHGTRILGGSLAQSQQIYEALKQFHHSRGRRTPVKLTKTNADFVTGSTASILAASSTSVRGPHVARLRLDEVDEIDPDIRESSLGMCMEMHGVPASVVMTSTWHRVGGPMGQLLEQGKAGAFPVHTFCAFEVLERCPEERSGPNLEKCPECPLIQWCHSDRDSRPDGLPKAKRSNGHYAIDSLIQKATILSPRVFGSDYLCDGPKADGVWFKEFSDANVTAAAEFDPALAYHVSIDSGVHTGAVLFQAREIGGDRRRGIEPEIRVNVFGDYFAEGKIAGEVADDVLALAERLCGSSQRQVSTDSAGGARNPVGRTVLAEYENAGLRGSKGLETWPKYPGCVADGLALIESLVKSADGRVHLTIHPRCRLLIDAMRGYLRAKRGGQWQDYPEDPQHPHEDMVDPLRGALTLLYPEGRRPAPNHIRIPASRMF